MSEVTRILSAIDEGDPRAAEQLLPLVYEELRKLAAQRLAQERPGQTLQATALVHEAYLRLVDVEQPQVWNGRGHFFAAAAEAMRRILVEQARRKQAGKRGGGQRRVALEDADAAYTPPDDDLLDIDAALTRLASEDLQAARLDSAALLRRSVGRGGRRGGRPVALQRLRALGLRQGPPPLPAPGGVTFLSFLRTNPTGNTHGEAEP